MRQRHRNAGVFRLSLAFMSLVISLSAAAAECPVGYAQREMAVLDADYVRQARDIAEWRDRQFRYAIDQFNAEYSTEAKKIYARLNTEKAALSERITEGDLRQATQTQRSEAAREIGMRFRADIAALGTKLRQNYRDQIARTREDVASMREGIAEFYREDRQALRNTIADGCRTIAQRPLRSVFIFVSGLIGRSSTEEPKPIPYGNLGIRG